MLTMIGAGPGDIRYLTLEAAEEIRRAPSLLAFPRVAESIRDLRRDVEAVASVDEMLARIREAGDTDVAVLVSGDALFFGFAKTLQARGIRTDRILPGISSVQYAFSKLQIPWEGARFMSFHGRDADLDAVAGSGPVAILLDRKYSAERLSFELYARGVRGKMTAISRASYPDERIVRASIGDAMAVDADLALAVIEIEVDGRR